MNSEKGTNRFLNRTWVILPIIHFLLSFVYERFIFKFGEEAWDIFWSVSMDSRFDNQFQSAILYIFSKSIAAILIFLIYYVFFYVIRGLVNKSFPKHIAWMYVSLMVVLGIYFFAFWPSSFSWQDSFTMYGFSTRLIPWYWHHFLTSAWYAGCLMVFPYPLIISFIQFAGFNALLVYTYYRIEKSFNPPVWVKGTVFLIFLAPETFWLISYGYRNCIYAIILMFYVVFLLLEKYDKAEQSRVKILLVCFLSALLSVWRTEGILVGVTGIFLYTLVIYKATYLKKIGTLLIFGVFFLVLAFPQKMGDVKYYGKDYLIASTVEPIKAILNDKTANLTYDGADEDLAAINNFASIDYIRQSGATGLRAYFFSKGHSDFNQSLASAEVSGAFLKAFFRLTLHNVDTYLKLQINQTFGAMELPEVFVLDEYEGEAIDTSFTYSIDSVGEGEYMRLALPLARNAVNKKLGDLFAPPTLEYRKFMQDNYIMAIIRVIILLADIAIMIAEFIGIIRKRREGIMFFFFAALFLAQFFIVGLTIPVPFSMYFYSIFFPCVVMEYIYIFCRINYRKKNREYQK